MKSPADRQRQAAKERMRRLRQDPQFRAKEYATRSALWDLARRHREEFDALIRERLKERTE